MSSEVQVRNSCPARSCEVCDAMKCAWCETRKCERCKWKLRMEASAAESKLELGLMLRERDKELTRMFAAEYW